jgi:hypothetical protein
VVAASPSVPTAPDGPERPDLARFLDDLCGVGTEVTGPVTGEPESPWVEAPEEWLVTAHRGVPLDPPARLRLDAREFDDALAHDTGVVGGWWPGGDPGARAYQALLLGFDAALVGVDRTPHPFVLEDPERLRLTTHHPCPDPLVHLDPHGGEYSWSARAPGTPESEARHGEQSRRSRHRRHAHLVLGWLEVEAAAEDGATMDAALDHLQDQVADAFGAEVFRRFTEHLERLGSPSVAALSATAHEEDERLDALLDALAGEPRED